MARLLVAISNVENGNMYIPGDTANEVVISNRQRWLASHGIDFANTTRLSITYDGQDFCRYRIVTDENKGEGMLGDGVQPGDAIVVTEPGHAAFLPVADCVATVFFDEVRSIFMLSHLGRHSLEQQGGVKSVEYLIEHFGVNPATLQVWLAPSPNKEVYPIYALDNKGMKEVLYEQLNVAGINPAHITDNAADTATDPAYYSHTTFLKGGKGEDGRFAMVAMMVKD
jgi:copper oxidase (laccase) domain-containing protein